MQGAPQGRCASDTAAGVDPAPYAGHGRFFVYFATEDLVKELSLKAHGSVVDTITRDTFDSVSAVLPPPATASMFESTVSPLMARIRANAQESLTLGALRDVLLPRLLSEEIGLREAEKVLERAGA